MRKTSGPVGDTWKLSPTVTNNSNIDKNPAFPPHGILFKYGPLKDRIPKNEI